MAGCHAQQLEMPRGLPHGRPAELRGRQRGAGAAGAPPASGSTCPPSIRDTMSVNAADLSGLAPDLGGARRLDGGGAGPRHSLAMENRCFGPSAAAAVSWAHPSSSATRAGAYGGAEEGALHAQQPQAFHHCDFPTTSLHVD